MRSYFYLATPYSKYKQGLEAAHSEACAISAEFMKHDIPIFCPIAHWHCIAQRSNLPTTADFFETVNSIMIEKSCGLVVIEMAGWAESNGILKEMEYANKINCPIIHLLPKSIYDGTALRSIAWKLESGVG